MENEPRTREKIERERERERERETLKRMTSSMVAGRPTPMHEWKKDGATETPSASDVMAHDADADAADDDTARKVPKSSTSSCCVQRGSSPMILMDHICFFVVKQLTFLCVQHQETLKMLLDSWSTNSSDTNKLCRRLLH